MKPLLTAALIAATAIPATIAVAPAAEASVIERACLSSDRKARNRALCGCIQQVANFSLSKSEQRMGAKFFKKPQLAQDTRQSDSPTKERFWKKWKAFGATASSYCS